ncbi:unnamed protein product [Linum trigynum]|uniref:Uncharacterized protein n=1 Tax=Linum trigynum TaxID=586398 RepID=A0AAV2CKZ9_9ROSI
MAESREHLFSQCDYFRQLFHDLLGRFSFMPRDWDDGLKWAIDVFGKKGTKAGNGRIIWQSLISYAWRERCIRLFEGKSRSIEGLRKVIRSEVLMLLQEEEAAEFWI